MSKPDLAIFDLDNTILNGDSDYSMINYLVDINLLDEVAKLKMMNSSKIINRAN
jgi:FMN phosphatase YigB (HAD superfamily)